MNIFLAILFLGICLLLCKAIAILTEIAIKQQNVTYMLSADKHNWVMWWNNLTGTVHAVNADHFNKIDYDESRKLLIDGVEVSQDFLLCSSSTVSDVLQRISISVTNNRNEALTELHSIADSARTEDRAMTQEEIDRFDELEAKART